MRRSALLIAAVVLAASGCVSISQRPPPASPILVTTPDATPAQAPTSPASPLPPSSKPTTHPTAPPTDTPAPSPPATSPPATADPPELPDTEACRDDTFNLSGYRWDRPLEWRFAEDTVPNRYDRGQVLDLVRRAFDHITGAYNDCGLPDRVQATAVYRGTATGEACGPSDGVNLVGFGRLRGNLLAITCPWVFGDDTYAEIDIEIDRNTDWAMGEECDNEYFLEAVITHEVGHAFGLGHVGERRHGALTMSTTGPTCDNAEATLGLGDVLGLEELYGP